MNPKGFSAKAPQPTNITGRGKGLATLGNLQGQVFNKPKTSTPVDPYGAANKQYSNLLGRNRLFVQGAPTQGFDPQFFNNYAQAYINYAAPQLAQQYDQTNRALQFGLANRGLTGGSAQDRAMSDLNLTMGTQTQGIVDTGIQNAQTLRSNLEKARSDAISQLYQTLNPSQAAATASASAAQFRAPQAFTPLSNAFSGLANQYATNLLYSYVPPNMSPYQGSQSGFNPQIPVSY